jgi:hypothetical protein
VLGWVAANQYRSVPRARDGYLASEPGKNCWTAPGTGTDVAQVQLNGSDALGECRLANVSTGVVIAGGVAAAGVVLYPLRPAR